MKPLTNFKAAYSSGIYIPDAATVSTLSLLFEKVYLPRNISFVKEFARKYRFTGEINTLEKVFRNIPEKYNIQSVSFDVTEEDGDDALYGLNEIEKETAKMYLMAGVGFANNYKSLFPEVFETNLLGGDISTKWRSQKEDQTKKKSHIVTMRIPIKLKEEDDFPNLLSQGYIPVISSHLHIDVYDQKLDARSAKQLASLLAMKSVEIVFPETRGAHPEVILEARERLSDFLPPFWSAMLKLSVDMRNRIKECKSVKEVFSEAQFLIDTVVMPSLIDLQQKMLKEEKDWFYRILSPIQKGLRVMIGNPPITQQQLLTNALVLGSDVIMSTAENMRTIDALKKEAGLTFLLEAQKILSKDDAA